jgi:beta-mannosidase
VQLDIAKADSYPDWFVADNWQDYRWMEDEHWTYRTQFAKPELGDAEGLFFRSEGIDYAFSIRMNGAEIWEQEGMFTSVELDLTELLEAENELSITIFPAPKLHDSPEDRTQAAQSVKPAVSYSWDWHPRLIPLGIWDETCLEVRPWTHIAELELHYQLTEELDWATLALVADGEFEADLCYSWQVTDPRGESVLDEAGEWEGGRIHISDKFPLEYLWWPHDHGEPNLYTSRFELQDQAGNTLDVVEKRIGFRRVRLVMNEGAWVEPVNFPKSRSVAPITLEINGRRIFGKGSNWVNPEVFPGLITRERYQEQLDLAKAANFNLLRQWGGSIVNKESFYELCDEMGLMVWQEFPLSCNNYEGTGAYLEVLEQEAYSIITRLRQHPSVVMWCGGNELFNNWSGMTDQSLALRMLNAMTYKLDQKSPFIPTAPVMGMGHGHYVFRDWDSGEEVFQSMPKAQCTAYTEFGMPGPSPVEVIKSFMPEDQLFPPKPGTVWETHHAYGAWQGNTWLMADTLEDYFGEAENLEELVANGQWLQGEGYKCIFEEARRQKPYCSMALNWCYNEPWPAAANNSLICWPNVPKPALYAVGDACRPVLLSARIPKFRWEAGEVFHCEVWLLNDRYEEIEPQEVRVIIQAGEERVELLRWTSPLAAENTNLAGPTARGILPNWATDRFEVVLEVEGQAAWNSRYLLRYDPAEAEEGEGTKRLNL